MSILNSLYDGDLCPAEQIVLHDRKYRCILKRQSKENDKLDLSLTPDQRKVFEKYKENVNHATEHLLRKSFQQGFRIGAKIIMEIERDK